MAIGNRIAVIGSGGAGKSTFSRRLGEISGLPVIHLDQLYWRSGWVETPREQWVAVQREMVEQDKWIMDGNYGSTMDMRLEAADTVIFLDFPRALCLARVLKRRVQYHGRTRPDLGEGCEEKMDLEFLKWIWNFPKRERANILSRLDAASRRGKAIVHLRSPKQVDEYLRSL
ncbi:MAG: DNA topology modulation protein [Bacilli bacterium]